MTRASETVTAAMDNSVTLHRKLRGCVEMLVATGAALGIVPTVGLAQDVPPVASVHAPTVYYACYRKSTGTVYRIKLSGLPTVCSSTAHEFSWTNAGTSWSGDHANSKWFNEPGPPLSDVGVLGDFHIDTTTGGLYRKTDATTWTLIGNIKGPAGAEGATGAAGPTGATGAAGAGPWAR